MEEITLEVMGCYDPDRNIIELWGDYPDVGWTIFEPLRNE